MLTIQLLVVPVFGAIQLIPFVVFKVDFQNVICDYCLKLSHSYYSWLNSFNVL